MSQETVEVDSVGEKRRAPVELVGRVVRGAEGWNPNGITIGSTVPLRVGDVLLASPSESPEHRHWRTGGAVVQDDGFINLRTITAICEGDYVYRIGKPLTPSLVERVTAIERLLGIAAEDLEVAADAEQTGRRDELLGSGRLRWRGSAGCRSQCGVTRER